MSWLDGSGGALGRSARIALPGPGALQHWLAPWTEALAPEERRLDADEAVALVRRLGIQPGGLPGLGRLLDDLGRGGAGAWGETRDQLESGLRRGQLVVIVAARELAPYDHDPELAEAAPPPAAAEPLVDADKSLRITQCDPILEPDAPLRFRYLLRSLAGQGVELRIHATGLATSVVHRRPLSPAEAADGAHEAEWDGVVTSPGALEGERLPARHGPGRVELWADEVYRDEAPFAIARAKVVIAVCGGPCFASGQALVLPDAPRALGDDAPAFAAGRLRVPALVAVELALRYADEHPERSVYVTGHADAPGARGKNQTLAEARADNLALYLSGDEAGWAEHCAAHYRVADQQRVLAWIHRRFAEFDCDPGAVDDELGPKTRGAQERFREAYAELEGGSVPTGDALTAADFRAVFALFDRALDELLGDDLELDAARSSLSPCDPDRRGFGEDFPVADATPAGGCDRRAEIVFIAEPELALVDDASGEALYGEEAEVEREYLDASALGGTLELRVIEAEGPALAGLPFELEAADGCLREALSDGGGRALLPGVRPGPGELHLPEDEALAAAEWYAGPERDDAPTAEELDDQDQALAWARLELDGSSADRLEIDGARLNWVVLERPRLRFVEPRTQRYDHASALLVPAPWTAGRHPLAALVHALLAILDAPERWLVIVGHASAPGSEQANLELSEHRADAARAILEDDGEAWVEHARERGGLRDVIAYLDYLGRRRGWACLFEVGESEGEDEDEGAAEQGGDDGQAEDPEAAPAEDPEAGPTAEQLPAEPDARTEATVSAFQGEYNGRFSPEEELAVDGVCGNKTLAAIFRVLRDEFERWLAKFGTKPEELALDRVCYRGYGATLAGRTERGEAESPEDDPERCDRLLDLIVVDGLAFDDAVEAEALYHSPVARWLPLELPHEPDEWGSGPFTIVSDLTPEEPAEPETYRLTTNGGPSWERVLPEDGEVEHGELVLRFDRVPTEFAYTLVVVSAGGNESVIFEAVAYGELHKGPRVSEERWER